MNNNFSALLSVYYKENPNFLNKALESIWDEQTLKPSQIVLAQDGPLTPELDAVLGIWKEKLDDILTLVPLPINVGLGAALNEGLKHCTNELVARMDTDDISLPERFSKQVQFMRDNPNIAVSSGLIEEWDKDFFTRISERKLPLTHKEILIFAKSRSPLSHPAVIFRKSDVLAVGGYPSIYPEDYPLWGAMLAKGYTFANLPDLLLKMRVGDALSKRRGLKFLKGEAKLFQFLYDVGFLNKYELCRNILQRSIVRLSPTWMKKILYKYAR